MSEWRQDPLSGRWVIIAARRGRRPDEFADTGHRPADPQACPFCPGHEHLTTPEIVASGRPAGAPADGPGWRRRVFPNLYPALTPDSPEPVASPWPVRAGSGHHEVVVSSPDHGATLQTLGAADLADLLAVVRDRVRVLGDLPAVHHVLPFFNQGAAAGATLAHPHGQILAGPLVPQLVAEKLQRSAAHRAATGRCLLCDLAAGEEAAGIRVVAAGPEAVLVAPWASRFPYEMLAVPRGHAPDLAAATDGDLQGLATVLATGLAGLERAVPAAALNLVIHGAPTAAAPAPGRTAFHWHLEVLPRLARLAGFEAGTGFAINAIPPERAAARLRGEET
jgi:UDPglucose--hexose-1-phosphate uridylyltransferase